MNTRLKLSHEEIVVLTAIADQALTSAEIAEIIKIMGTRASVDRFSEAPSFVLVDINSFLKEPLFVLLNEMVSQGILNKTWVPPFWYYYAIAPDVLALNSPPYSYESWRRLGD